MLFTSFTFIIFFVIIVSLMFLVQTFRFQLGVQHCILLISSYVFYGWWDWRFCFLMLAMTVIAYISSIKRENKIFRGLGIVAPLVILGIFKYFNFFIDTFCSLFRIEHVGALNIILPIGISFFTFQSMSYTIDVWRGNQKPVGFVKLALYIAFFPPLVAGPIVKASDFLPQLDEKREISLSGIEKGVQIFVFGLFKKIVLADHLSVFVDEVFAVPAAFAAPTLILAVVSYSLQIYFDFSGYSDMAIGAAKILGYDIKPNFNIPYISKNLTDFWRRWHISLSRWLQQYLYIPLGGNRKGKARTYLNLIVTMALGGLWHGANWTFVIWGLLHGLGLCVHKFYTQRISSAGNKNKFPRRKQRDIKGEPRNAPRGGELDSESMTHLSRVRGAGESSVTLVKSALSILCTYIFVCFCWVFFRATDFHTACAYIRGIFLWQNGINHMFIWSFVSILAVLIGMLVATLRAKKQKLVINGFYPTYSLNTVKGLFVLFVAIGFILGLAYLGNNPFIYFQF